MHAQSCKSHCHGGVKVVLGGFAALCWGEVHSEIRECGAVLGGNAFRELQIALSELQIALGSERK